MRYAIRIGALAAILAVLAGCTSTESTLSPDAVEPATSQQSTSPAATTPQSPASPAVAGALSAARVQFAPIVGSTVEAVTPLSRRLTLRAKESGLKLVATGDPATTHLVKGYFSALSEGGQTTVIYVWDILDGAGNRLSRIQGQEKANGTAPDPWTVVPAATMETIADRIMSELTAWLAAHPV